MKNVFLSQTLIVISTIILFGCSKDENIVVPQEEFLMAKVDGEEYSIRGVKSTIECKKYLTEFGSINLAVKARNEEGRIIEILILNYHGANTYPIGNHTYTPEYSFVNGNWMKYSETLSQGIWSTSQNDFISERNILEITNDNGSIISGTFSFDAKAEVGESIRSISEGNFTIEIDR